MGEHRYKILLVDDEAKFREPFERILKRRLKANITGIDNGPDAIEAIRKLTYDLVILDINIPGCDGWEVLRSVREFNKQIKFIAISGLAEFSDDQAKVLAQETCAFVKKPVNVGAMVRQVAQLIGGEILEECPESRINDYKGRPEVRDVIHAFKNLYNNVELECVGFLADCEDDIFKDKSKEELIAHVQEMVQRIRKNCTNHDQLFDILRKI